MIVVGIVLLALALFLLIVGGLASARRLPGNNVIGLRVEEVRKDKATWDTAHAVAGPFWCLAGLTLLFGGLAALRAGGWTWLLAAVSIIVAILAVSVGANMGARAAHVLDERRKAEEGSSGGGCGGDCNCGGSAESADAPAAAPAVDLEALRRAAQQGDA